MSRLNEFWSVLRSLHRCLIFMDMYIDEICFIMSALWEAFSAWPWSSRSARTAGNCSVMTERALIVSFLKMFTCEKISEIFVSSLRILSAILITFTTPLFGCISPPWSLSDHKWKCHHTNYRYSTITNTKIQVFAQLMQDQTRFRKIQGKHRNPESSPFHPGG